MTVSVVVIGAGQRGRHVYGRWIADHPEQARVVAVVDDDRDRREAFAADHGLDRSVVFADVDDLWSKGRVADACIIASPDRLHHGHTVAALDAAYEVLVEKPMAATIDQVLDLASRAEAAQGSLHVAHVLRYAPLFQALHAAVQPDQIGDVVTVSHRENVWAFHMAHSFVRGNWARAAESTPMIVAKTCHDFDILTWNLTSPVRRLSSFGRLTHFRPEHAPEGATERCTDGCPVDDCPFDARRVYLDPDLRQWPIEVITQDLSPEGRLTALRSGPYGRCVYKAGSDVVDHQVVTMELDDGAVATLTLHGHSDVEERTMRYDGTRATVRARTGSGGAITVTDHRGGATRAIPIDHADEGHLGGDSELMRGFIASVRVGSPGATDAASAVQSHVLAFLAERARLEGTVIEIPV